MQDWECPASCGPIALPFTNTSPAGWCCATEISLSCKDQLLDKITTAAAAKTTALSKIFIKATRRRCLVTIFHPLLQYSVVSVPAASQNCSLAQISRQAQSPLQRCLEDETDLDLGHYSASYTSSITTTGTYTRRC